MLSVLSGSKDTCLRDCVRVLGAYSGHGLRLSTLDLMHVFQVKYYDNVFENRPFFAYFKSHQHTLSA